jgi:hypothetical protein
MCRDPNLMDPYEYIQLVLHHRGVTLDSGTSCASFSTIGKKNVWFSVHHGTLPLKLPMIGASRLSDVDSRKMVFTAVAL